MVDTQRSLSDLLTTLFQDGQPDGSITPQHIRDLIVSITPAMGALYFSTPVETVIGSAGVKVKALGTTTPTLSLHDVDMPQNNRLRYIGTVERHFVVDAAISAIIGGNNLTAEFQLCKSGVLLPETLMTRAFGTGADHGSVALTTSVHMEPGDYIELFVSNESDTSGITITNGTINLLGILVE